MATTTKPRKRKCCATAAKPLASPLYRIVIRHSDGADHWTDRVYSKDDGAHFLKSYNGITEATGSVGRAVPHILQRRRGRDVILWDELTDGTLRANCVVDKPKGGA